MRSLRNKTLFITGASRGIGKAIALRAALDGANIAIAAKTERPHPKLSGTIHTVAEEVEKAGGRALPLKLDIRDSERVRQSVDAAATHFGGIDILVNNAGIGGVSMLVEDLPPEAWDRAMAVNLKGAFNCCRSVIPIMRQKGWGKIVNIASLAASRMSKLGGADYTAAKHGVVGFSHHLAFELAAHGINVNVICPGATLTPLVESKTTAEFRTEVAAQIPLNRWVLPEDIAEAALFLASDRAAMITGVVLGVDGGQLLGIASDY